MSRNLTRRERAAGKVKRAPPPPKPPGAHKPKRLPWTDAEVAAMKEDACAARQRLAAACEAKGHVLWRRTPCESFCVRCGHVERVAVPERKRSRVAAALFAMAAGLGGMPGGINRP